VILILTLLLFLGKHSVVDIHKKALAEEEKEKLKNAQKGDSIKGQSIFVLLKIIPIALVAGVIYGMINQIIYYITPTFGKELGITSIKVNALISVYAIGGGTLIFFFSALVDKYQKRFILMCLGGAVALLPIVLMVSGSIYWLLLVVFFILGGVLASIDPLADSLYGEKIKGVDFARTVSAYSSIFGIGAITGPYLYIAFSDYFKIEGFLYVISILGTVLSIAALISHRRFTKTQQGFFSAPLDVESK
jgi:predicted MFS family arabinose efflux permease